MLVTQNLMNGELIEKQEVLFIKIKSLFEGINAQVKRGQYAFVQVHIERRQRIQIKNVN